MSESNNSHLPCFNQPEFSPMTEISINLSGTKISQLHTRKRRLSLTDDCENLETFQFDSGNSENFSSLKTSLTRHRRGLQDITNTPVSTTRTKSYSLIDSPSRSHDGDLSLYGGATPETGSPACSPELPKKSCRKKSLYLFGHTDSGFGCSFQESLETNQENESVTFLEPTPKRSLTSKSLFRAVSDFEVGDDFMEFLEVDTLDDNARLPIDFSKLVSGNILATKKSSPSSTITSTSERDNRTTSRVRLFPTSPESTPLSSKTTETQNTRNINPCTLKRSKSLFDSSDKLESKRYKHTVESSILAPLTSECSTSTPTKKPVFRRSMSTCSPNTIMSAVQRSSVEPDLIGDFSKPFILPLVSGRHQDLKSITSSTLAKLLRGEYESTVFSFKVIDCRYPYEYEGGHIMGSYNYYTKEQIETEVFNIKKNNPPAEQGPGGKRDIVIFHCEFSAQRGPQLFRFLRAIDRNYNVYPNLHYPEIYLLEGGYKSFFESYSELCEPVAYMRMNDPAHEEECRLFRAQKRSANNAQPGRKLVTKRSALEF